MNNGSSDHGQSPEGARPAAPGYYFAQIPTYLLDAVIAGQIPDTALRVYATIWRRYAFMGKIFPSWDTLAKDCGLSRRTVARILQQLREVGAITWTARFDDQGQTSNQYALADRIPFVFTYGQDAPTQSRGGVTNGTGGMSQMAPDVKKTPTKEVTTPPTPQRPAAEGVGSADGGGDKKLATGTDTAYLDAARTFCQQAGYQAQQKTVAKLAADLPNLFQEDELPEAIERASMWPQPDRPSLGALRARVRSISSQMKAGDQVTAMRRPRAGFVLRAGASPEGHEEVSTTLHGNWAKFDDPQQAAN